MVRIYLSGEMHLNDVFCKTSDTIPFRCLLWRRFDFSICGLSICKKNLFSEKRFYYYRWRHQSSSMFYAKKNLAQKYANHICFVNILAKYWAFHGVLKEYGKGFFCMDHFVPWSRPASIYRINESCCMMYARFEKPIS